jgi:hypothetical protein
MDCPQCNNDIEPSQQKDGSSDFVCPECGWGEDLVEQVFGNTAAALEPVKWGQFIGYWILSVLVIFGPYYFLVYGLPRIQEFEPMLNFDFQAGYISYINANYRWWMLVYLVVAFVLTPRVDTDDLGWGGGLVDNPFSYSDDLNRAKLVLVIILMPGKIVFLSVRNTILILLSRR